MAVPKVKRSRKKDSLRDEMEFLMKTGRFDKKEAEKKAKAKLKRLSWK